MVTLTHISILYYIVFHLKYRNVAFGLFNQTKQEVVFTFHIDFHKKNNKIWVPICYNLIVLF